LIYLTEEHVVFCGVRTECNVISFKSSDEYKSTTVRLAEHLT